MMRKLRLHISNFVHMMPEGLGATTFIVDDKKGGTVSESPARMSQEDGQHPDSASYADHSGTACSVV
jgi:hypothetical protein